MNFLQTFTPAGETLWRPCRSVSCLLGLLTYLDCVTPLNITPMTSGLRSAFSATRSTSVLGGSHRAVTFDHLLVNVGDDFNPDTGHFRCRLPGTYYFSFTVGKFPKKMLSVMLVKNRMEVQAIAHDGSRNQGRKVESQSVMISLKPFDTVYLLLQESPDYVIYSNIGPHITFSGYLVYQDSTSSIGYLNNHLSPPGLHLPVCPPPVDPHYDWNRRAANEEPRSAFSVARTSSELGEHRGYHERVALTFDVEYVNIGGHFNKTSGRFTCHFPGAYYFAFTVGKHPRRAVSVKLMRGRAEVQAMVFNEDMSRRREMQSQSLLLSLKRGDSIWLYSQQDEGYAVYSNQGRYTTFSGFLVYPDGESMNTDRTFP
ncbi:complement C1q tumor necrosis factor-related protein 4-like [Myxocyprinus asiaticus]|uniref:complement C1q tumor necrosis factor-related protein 4-like n=1 Tax=Myxocyprinus asiaticus TaxID=70543 RepID=UPI00222274EB|nr:complement C1q tumor necrosis factor-related protein 4-like [Myxocyprinus asiaticus]